MKWRVYIHHGGHNRRTGRTEFPLHTVGRTVDIPGTVPSDAEVVAKRMAKRWHVGRHRVQAEPLRESSAGPRSTFGDRKRRWGKKQQKIRARARRTRVGSRYRDPKTGRFA